MKLKDIERAAHLKKELSEYKAEQNSLRSCPRHEFWTSGIGFTGNRNIRITPDAIDAKTINTIFITFIDDKIEEIKEQLKEIGVEV